MSLDRLDLQSLRMRREGTILPDGVWNGLLDRLSTGLGTREPLPVERPRFQAPFFKPHLIQGSPAALEVWPGYVFAAYDDGTSTRRPMCQQFPFEPTMSGSLLTATPRPTLSLTLDGSNFQYLKFTWASTVGSIGGQTYDSDYALATQGLQKTEAGKSTGNAGTHDHSGEVSSDGDHNHTIPQLNMSQAYMKVKERSYYLTGCEVINHVSDTPPTETDLVTYHMLGHHELDANGFLNTTNPTARTWLVDGHVYAHRPAIVFDGSTAVDRTEPPAPSAPSGTDIPGWEE